MKREVAVPTLRDVVYENVREGELYDKLDRNRVRCYACGHCCPIPEGQPGVCKVRYNRGGTLYVPWGYVGGVQCDPIEKKPFFHAYPGSLAYSFGMLGCDLHCGYCQNWVTSQALRDPHAVSPPLEASPEALVRDALGQGAKVLVSTYNEPLITSEWAVAAVSYTHLDVYKRQGLRMLPSSGGLPCLGWSKPASYFRSEARGAWSLNLDLVTPNNRRYGSMIMHRLYAEPDLQLDINLLTSLFSSVLAEALDRTLGRSVTDIPTAVSYTHLGILHPRRALLPISTTLSGVVFSAKWEYKGFRGTWTIIPRSMVCTSNSCTRWPPPES